MSNTSIPVLAINLERSKDRWQQLSQRAEAAGVQLTRIDAVDGRALEAEKWDHFDARGFRLWHGRRPLAAEYGCYMSHIKALRHVADNQMDFALILEDDATFEPDFLERLEAIRHSGHASGVVKLFNHRLSGFVRKGNTSAGDNMGACIHGPLGSAMAYTVTAQAALKLQTALLPMFLPYDIALERGWAHGVKVLTTAKPLARPQPQKSTIGSYGSTKLPRYKRLTTAGFRGVDYVRRAAYSFYA